MRSATTSESALHVQPHNFCALVAFSLLPHLFTMSIALKVIVSLANNSIRSKLTTNPLTVVLERTWIDGGSPHGLGGFWTISSGTLHMVISPVVSANNILGFRNAG
jgi:hypothetical protein